MQGQTKTKQNELLAAISQKPIPQTPSSTPHTSSPTAAPASIPEQYPQTQVTPVPAAITPAMPIRTGPAAQAETQGKGISFYFQPDETKRIRELAAWLSSQGIRTSDSLIMKSALRVAKPNAELLNACRDAMRVDRRYKGHKASRSRK